jgi:hypothetical protein
MLTTLCAIAVAGRSGAPHPPQNPSPGSLAKPQAAQASASAPPHFEQEGRPSRFSVWQREHVIVGGKFAKVATIVHGLVDNP